MIHIDDSGWGSLIGGVMIGLYNTNSGRFKCKLIPVSCFKGNKFRSGAYRAHAVKAFSDMYKTIGESSDFEVCRGTVLDSVYDYISQGKCVKVKRVEIKDPLQSWLEDKFAQSLVKIGVPRMSNGAHCLSFDGQLEWIKEDPKRIKYVKTGWNSWKTKYSKDIQ